MYSRRACMCRIKKRICQSEKVAGDLNLTQFVFAQSVGAVSLCREKKVAFGLGWVG